MISNIRPTNRVELEQAPSGDEQKIIINIASPGQISHHFIFNFRIGMELDVCLGFFFFFSPILLVCCVLLPQLMNTDLKHSGMQTRQRQRK